MLPMSPVDLFLCYQFQGMILLCSPRCNNVPKVGFAATPEDTERPTDPRITESYAMIQSSTARKSFVEPRAEFMLFERTFCGEGKYGSTYSIETVGGHESAGREMRIVM
jgi:hypothetical protein